MDAQARDHQRTSSVYEAPPEMPSSSNVNLSADRLPIDHHRAAVPLLRQPSCFRPASPSAQLLGEYQQYTGAVVLPQPQSQPQSQPQPRLYAPAYAFDPEPQARYCVSPPAQLKIESPEHTSLAAYPVEGYSYNNQGYQQEHQHQQQQTEAGHSETSLPGHHEGRANTLSQPSAGCKCGCNWVHYPPQSTSTPTQQLYHPIAAQQTAPGMQQLDEIPHLPRPLYLYAPEAQAGAHGTVPETPLSIPLSSSAISSMTTDSETQTRDSVCRQQDEEEEEEQRRRDSASRARICAAVRAIHDLCLQSTQAYLQTHRTNRQARAAHPLHVHNYHHHHLDNNNNTLPPEPTTSLLQNVSAICGMLWAGAQRDRLHVLDVERIAVDNMGALLAWAETVALGDRDDWARALAPALACPRADAGNEGGCWFPGQAQGHGGGADANGVSMGDAGGDGNVREAGTDDADGEYALWRVFEAGRNLCNWLGVADGVQGMSALEEEIWGLGVGGGDSGGREDRMYEM